jgi:hypothetical protein
MTTLTKYLENSTSENQLTPAKKCIIAIQLAQLVEALHQGHYEIEDNVLRSHTSSVKKNSLCYLNLTPDNVLVDDEGNVIGLNATKPNESIPFNADSRLPPELSYLIDPQYRPVGLGAKMDPVKMNLFALSRILVDSNAQKHCFSDKVESLSEVNQDINSYHQALKNLENYNIDDDKKNKSNEAIRHHDEKYPEVYYSEGIYDDLSRLIKFENDLKSTEVELNQAQITLEILELKKKYSENYLEQAQVALNAVNASLKPSLFQGDDALKSPLNLIKENGLMKNYEDGRIKSAAEYARALLGEALCLEGEKDVSEEDETVLAKMAINQGLQDALKATSNMEKQKIISDNISSLETCLDLKKLLLDSVEFLSKRTNKFNLRETASYKAVQFGFKKAAHLLGIAKSTIEKKESKSLLQSLSFLCCDKNADCLNGGNRYTVSPVITR